MAKMTRGALKNIVKECLIEVLTEGLAESPVDLNTAVDNYSSHLEEQRGPSLGHRPRPVAQGLARPRSAALDSPVRRNRNFESNVKTAVQTLTSDPLMQELLADTAMGTLQETAAHDPSLGRVTMAGTSAGRPNLTAGPTIPGDPMKIFDAVSPGSSSKWAHLAFAGSKLPGA